jgi:hypothetical protein
MNKEYHLEGVKVVKHDVEDGKFEKKYKRLHKLLMDSFSNKSYQTIICCSEANLDLLNSKFLDEKIDFAIIDERNITLNY